MQRAYTRLIPLSMVAPAVAFVLVAGLIGGCATAQREAEPLPIQRVSPPPEMGPPTIARLALEDVLAKGPGRFLARMPVEPYRGGDRAFVGYRILALYGGAASGHPEGLHVGDIVTAVNEHPIARPEQFMKVWQDASRARAIAVDIIREQQPMRVVYRITD